MVENVCSTHEKCPHGATKNVTQAHAFPESSQHATKILYPTYSTHTRTCSPQYQGYALGPDRINACNILLIFILRIVRAKKVAFYFCIHPAHVYVSDRA